MASEDLIPEQPLPPPALQVRVPGSTSNLGPGFDCLGLALSLFLEVRLVASGDGPLELRGGAAGDSPGADLVCRALVKALAQVGRKPRGMRIEQRSEIPVARGLGSSGAAVAAGLLLARALEPEALSLELLIELGIELEGHPDNVVASLLGGLTLGVPAGPGARTPVLSLPLSADLGIAAAWPASCLSTERARAVLPTEVPLADAVENARRLPLLLRGLAEADPHLLRFGSEDRLHTAYRLPLLPGAADALERARGAGAWMATISGSGSALVALGPREHCAAVAAALSAGLSAAGEQPTARTLDAVFGTPVVRPVGSLGE